MTRYPYIESPEYYRRHGYGPVQRWSIGRVEAMKRNRGLLAAFVVMFEELGRFGSS